MGFDRFEIAILSVVAFLVAALFAVIGYAYLGADAWRYDHYNNGCVVYTKTDNRVFGDDKTYTQVYCEEGKTW